MKNIKLFFVIACLVLSILLLCSCGENQDISGGSSSEVNTDEMSADYNESAAVKIVFSDNSASVKGLGASATGADVRIGSQGTYILSGSTSSGSLVIDASKAIIRIVLDNVSITNTDGPAIWIKNASKVIFTLPDGTNSVLTDGDAYEIKEVTTLIDGTIFAKSDLAFNGTGTLTVNGNNAHGIVGKDGLTIVNSNINVTSTGAGICGKDYIKSINANLNINAGTDGLRSDNMTQMNKGYITIQGGTYNITSENDAIQAYSLAKIESGSFNIKTTSTDPLASSKGVKATLAVDISGGSFVIDSVDDSVHSDGNVVISGGELSISSNDDGIHANKELAISGGKVVINKSYEGLEASVVKLYGGHIEITSSDDGINSAGGNDQSGGSDSFDGTSGIDVAAGYIVIHSGADGIDVLGPFNMTGGVLIIDGPSKEKSGALDFGSSSSITGGIIVALGFSKEPETFERASQGIALVENNGAYAAGDVISVCDTNGSVIFAFTSTRTFNGMLISAPEFQPGNSVAIYKNANVVGLDQNGFAKGTTQTGGTLVSELNFQ